MGREKRKSRLNKGEASEFIGFGAFASVATNGPTAEAASTSIPDDPNTNGSVPTVKSSGKSLALAPVYLGSESELSLLFPRIGQKRDATTNTKALQELKEYFRSETPPKKAQVDALAHFLYLFQSKLYYDNTPRVRAAALECCVPAMQRVPKAFVTLTTSQPDLLGMMLCGRADPASDVRKAAEQVYQTLMTTSDLRSQLTTSIRQGMWDYVQRIVSYGKPITMHQDLFQKKSSSSSSSSSQDNSKLSERQEEELEERFVRIVGTAISGLQLYLQNQHQQSEDAIATAPHHDDTKYLWKTLTSPKAALRRKTYQLLSTCCQKLPTLVDTTKIANILNQNLSSEKEPTNVKILLETLLALVSSVPREERSTFLSQFTKALTKLFSKGCYGANQWAPTVLPIVALLPSETQPNILTSIWEGKDVLVGTVDQLQVVTAIAETAAFLLLQKPHVLAEVLAECWLQALQVYMTRSIGNNTSNSYGAPIGQAYDDLGQLLANNLQRFDTVRTTKPDSSLVVELEDWFWGTKIPNAVVKDAAVDLTQLMNLINRFPTTTSSDSHVFALWKQLFHHYLQQCQASSGMVPGQGIYQVWMLLLERISMKDIFSGVKDDDGSTSMETFVMNDLLRWMVIHTSSLSDQFDTDLAKYDFQLYRHCRHSNSRGEVKGTWDPLLRELVAAKCDLEALVAGLVILTQSDILGIEAVRSTILDNLCRQVAKESIIELHAEEHEDSEEEDFSDATELHMHYHRKASDLLQTCVGLGEVEGVIVDGSVVTHWIELACPKNPAEKRSPNAVLETLIALIKDDYFQESDEMERILLQTWRQGEDLWKESVLPWIEKHKSLRAAVTEEASSELKATLRQASSESKVDPDVTLEWSERAVRLFDLFQNESEENDTNTALAAPSLELIGLAEPRIWDYRSITRKGFAGASLMNIMELLETIEMGDWEYRWSLFANSATADPDQLLILILLHLSDATNDVLLSDPSRKRQDDSFTLLSKLGGKSISDDRLFRWMKSCLSTISPLFALGDDEITCRCVAVLSQLVSVGFSSVQPALVDDEKDKISVDKLQEGDSVWYITEAKKPQLRQACTIAKIHNDLPHEVYFTIKIEYEGKIQEKQTVGERLRNDSAAVEDTFDRLIPIDQIDPEESNRRERFSTLVMNELVSSSWDSWRLYEFEILNVLVTQFGIPGPHGIGTMHYSIFKKLLSLQNECVEKLNGASAPQDFPIDDLWSLALALGYGCNTPTSSENISLIHFDPEAIVGALLKLFYDEEVVWLKSPSEEIMRATIVLLTTMLPALKASEKLENAKSLLYLYVERSLNAAAKDSGFTQDDYIALRAMQSPYGEEEYSTQDGAIVELVGAFSSRWETKETAPWLQLNLCQSVLREILSKKQKLAGMAARKHCECLASSLFVSSKAWLSLRFLAAYASQGKPIHDNVNGIMNKLTSKRVKTWSTNLVPEEAEELVEDIEIVCQWVPERLMNEIESWQDATGHDYHVDERDAVGRLTSWLAYLRIADVAGGKDSLNRTAFTSYARKCGAVDAVLNLAMLYANVGTDRKVKFESVDKEDALFSRDESATLPKLAAAVLFQTVRLLPTLAKNWWETCCPSYFRDAVRDFVETSVAPELLRREIHRIKVATSFGDMTVKGSAVSREVTALYRQDDFTLTAVIKLPPFFPFRRAEVDCSKTLGVPEGRWKRWSLQITQMLNNQGGTLTDALLLWKENVDKEFEGIEPCPVCYSVLHVKTHKLPEMQCKTCQNRFHFECLTQWFRSSGKNACVICQQPWAGTRV